MPDLDPGAPAPPPDASKRAAPAPAVSRAVVAALGGAFVAGAITVALVVRQTTATESAVSSAAAAPVPAPRQAARGSDVDGARPEWTGSTRPKWARDGSKMVMFEHLASHDVAVWMKRVRPVLAVRCLYGRTEVFVVPETAASIEANDRHTVHVRFDDGPDQQQSWEESVDSQELFAPDGEAMARLIAGSRSMRFAFTPYNASPVVVDFDVQGFDKLIGSVAKTCHWR